MEVLDVIYEEPVSNFFYELKYDPINLGFEYDSFASDEDIFKKFEDLKESWLSETLFLSNPKLKYENENYKEIIKLDSFVLAYLIEDLRENNIDWLFALRKITGTNPIKNEHQGNFELMKKDWLRWAEENIIQQYAFNDFGYGECA